MFALIPTELVAENDRANEAQIACDQWFATISMLSCSVSAPTICG